MNKLRLTLQIALPLLILAGGVGLAKWIGSKKPEPKIDRNAFVGPIVRTAVATAQEVMSRAPRTIAPLSHSSGANSEKP